jgi:hypothetical protein
MKLLVAHPKKTKYIMDMGGFPDEVTVEDKTKVVVLEDYTQNDIMSAIEYSPIPNLTVLIHPALTEKQVDTALIAYLWTKESKVIEDIMR